MTEPLVRLHYPTPEGQEDTYPPYLWLFFRDHNTGRFEHFKMTLTVNGGQPTTGRSLTPEGEAGLIAAAMREIESTGDDLTSIMRPNGQMMWVTNQRQGPGGLGYSVEQGFAMHGMHPEPEQLVAVQAHRERAYRRWTAVAIGIAIIVIYLLVQ